MTLELMSLVLIGGLILLLVMGVEVAVAIGIMASIGLFVFVSDLNEKKSTSSIRIFDDR